MAKKKTDNGNILSSCINYIKKYLVEHCYKIVSTQDLSWDEPQIWYKDKYNNKYYVLITIKDSDDNYAKNKKQLIKKNIKYSGYEAVISIDQKSKSKNLNIRLTEYLRINRVILDTEEKCKNIERENPYELIKRAINQPSISDKQTIGVYPIPGYPDFLLKIHNVFVSNIQLLKKDLTLIPFVCDPKIKNNSHFGIPLYHIDAKDSEYAKKGCIHPKEIIFIGTDVVSISILKKVSGESVKKEYSEVYKLLNGQTTDPTVSTDATKMINITLKYGEMAANKALDYLKKGIYEIPKDELSNGSAKYKFTPDNDFYVAYCDFVKNYLGTIRKISNLPQKTFNNAIKNIYMQKDFIFDFEIPNNTLIDYETEEFNFIDFIYDDWNKKRYDFYNRDIISDFTNTLLGLYNKNSNQPINLLFRLSDVEMFDYYRRIISDKVNKAYYNYEQER